MISPFAAERRTGVELMVRLSAKLCGNIVTEAPVFNNEAYSFLFNFSCNLQ